MNANDQGRFEQQQADITNLEHMLLTPVFQMVTIIEIVMTVLALILWTALHGTFGMLGGWGMEARDSISYAIRDTVAEDVSGIYDGTWRRSTSGSALRKSTPSRPAHRTAQSNQVLRP